MTQGYAFDVRQTNYYTDACRYLGLIEKTYVEQKILYNLTTKGNYILGLPYKKRQLSFCESILENRVFFDIFKECLLSGGMPDRDRVVCHMKQSKLYKRDSESTYLRRASTISSWLNWIISLWTV